MQKIKKTKEYVSIRSSIIVWSTILILTTGTIIGTIVFSNLLNLADDTIAKLAREMNNEVFHELEMFVNIPNDINKINHEFIETGIVDINDAKEREKFFVEVLSNSNENVYSFSFGTESGEYYGARRNENKQIEIMKNNEETGGHSWYYSLTENMTSTERVVDAGKFDPRTREWYKVAKQEQKPVFSPIYKHFVMNDLTVSASVPVYNQTGVLQGVLGTHITLTSIENYMKEIAKEKKAISLIIEKDSGKLVANSLDMANFTSQKDGSLKRVSIDEIDNPVITKGYENYLESESNNVKMKNRGDNYHINFSQYQNNGLDWLVITALPGSLLTSGIFTNIVLTVVLTLLAFLISITICLKLINKYLRPIDDLIHTTEMFSQGNLSQRASIMRKDEIGRLAISFNKMADTIFTLIHNLEEKVTDRTQELQKTNKQLTENKNKLKLILNSTVEGIFGIDNQGNCTFCNESGLKLLGYSHQDELSNKKIHYLIHHSYEDGSEMPLDDCKIYQSLQKGKGTHADDEVFWRKDGTSFIVEYHSYPQFVDDQVVGAVVTFVDNTERKKNEDYIRYLSFHDSLTDLHNRIFFEEKLKRLDDKNNWPISIIFGDVNGLKLTNDIFGHGAGDELLIKSAEILKRVCRKNDIVARVGGDEFAILLPSTNSEDAGQIMERIKKEFSSEKFTAIKGSISLGCATKTCPTEKMEQTMELAEDRMYKEKMLNRKTINSSMINTIIETLHSKSEREKQHSIAVSELCAQVGQAMNKPETEVRKLKDAGYLHDIGKIILNEEILKKEASAMVLTAEEQKEFEQHSIVGYRILNLFEETMDLAEGILNHHENWDGSGYPKGLKGEEIPEIARIIQVTEGYDSLVNPFNDHPLHKEEALQELKKQAGTTFDPNIINLFIDLKNQ